MTYIMSQAYWLLTVPVGSTVAWGHTTAFPPGAVLLGSIR